MRTAAVFNFLFLCFFSSILLAQHGTAPAGYYPPGYYGDMFTGTVTAVNAESNSLTLEYTGRSKTESLTVKLDGGCAVPSQNGARMQASDIPTGNVLTIFYMAKTEKQDGKKTKVYVAVGVSFVKWIGQQIAEEKWKMYSCG